MAKNEHIPLLHEALLNIARSATARDHEFPSCGAHAPTHARSLSLALASLALSLSASLFPPPLLFHHRLPDVALTRCIDNCHACSSYHETLAQMMSKRLSKSLVILF